MPENEVIFFKSKRKINIWNCVKESLLIKKLSKKSHPAESARYIEIIIDENLNWKNKPMAFHTN